MSNAASSSNAAAQAAAFNVGETYKIVDVVGEGAYGVVWLVIPSLCPTLFCLLFYSLIHLYILSTSSAIHLPSSSRVAIKRITPFDHSMFCLRTLREIKLLRHFNHENIISILDIVKPESYEAFQEVYLIQVSWWKEGKRGGGWVHDRRSATRCQQR